MVLFSIVGIALYGLPFFYDFMVRDFGWTRTQVTSGNAFSKLIVGPLFGFVAGYTIDRFGPRRMMMSGIVMAGGALIGLSLMSGMFWVFYLCYLFNALGYVCGGLLPNQVLLSGWCDKSRGKAMGVAYVGIGIGGEYMIIPLVAAELFGVKVLGRLLGIILTADGVAEAVTPMVVAGIRDPTGSYDAGFILLTGLAF
jgi:MFS family permease